MRTCRPRTGVRISMPPSGWRTDATVPPPELVGSYDLESLLDRIMEENLHREIPTGDAVGIPHAVPGSAVDKPCGIP